MIYDRTYQDISDAKKIYLQKIQKFLPLSNEEQEVIDRAFFNLNTLNRIIRTISVVWQMVVNKGGQKFDCPELKPWLETDIFKKENFENIINNIKYLLEQVAFLNVVDRSYISEYRDLSNRINNSYSYINLNDIERLLSLLQFAATKEPRWVVKDGDTLYISGAYETIQDGEELKVV